MVKPREYAPPHTPPTCILIPVLPRFVAPNRGIFSLSRDVFVRNATNRHAMSGGVGVTVGGRSGIGSPAPAGRSRRRLP